MAELDKARPGAEVQARPDEQQQHRQAPDQGVELVVDGRDGLNKAEIHSVPPREIRALLSGFGPGAIAGAAQRSAVGAHRNASEWHPIASD